MTDFELDEKSLRLLRHELASVDLSDVEDEKEMSEAEYREYEAAISGVWPRLERDLKRAMYNQLVFGMNESLSWGQLLMARGTFNGLSLMFEKWRGAHTANMSRIGGEKNKKDFIDEK